MTSFADKNKSVVLKGYQMKQWEKIWKKILKEKFCIFFQNVSLIVQILRIIFNYLALIEERGRGWGLWGVWGVTPQYQNDIQAYGISEVLTR